MTGPSAVVTPEARVKSASNAFASIVASLASKELPDVASNLPNALGDWKLDYDPSKKALTLTGPAGKISFAGVGTEDILMNMEVGGKTVIIGSSHVSSGREYIPLENVLAGNANLRVDLGGRYQFAPPVGEPALVAGILHNFTKAATETLRVIEAALKTSGVTFDYKALEDLVLPSPTPKS